MKTIIVFVLGIMIGTIGLTGTVNVLSHGIDKIQTVAKEAAK